MCMCMSIRPGLSNAASSFSMWLVVKIRMRSSPQQDHKPSVKFNSPESVIRLFSSSFNLSSSLGLNGSDLSQSFPPRLDLDFGVRWPDRLMEQSMSSITMMDLFVVWMSSCRSSLLLNTWTLMSKIERKLDFNRLLACHENQGEDSKYPSTNYLSQLKVVDIILEEVGHGSNHAGLPCARRAI